ncbi:hypothetical protein IDM40_04285 [Nocardiopsis sp. HNM0947]|uniref:Recombinase-like domain-containing protein n=2 Tax=Nocardiopsis coralli TaxID=2772213 RepID=A0ABR9P2A3_9ACTN|nr:hypothetical protein [Nocardiopsis coralli]
MSEPRTGALQSAGRAPTSYENALSDELERVFGRGTHDLPGVVAALNETGVRPAHGGDWTEDTFTTEMARLGALGEDGPR